MAEYSCYSYEDCDEGHELYVAVFDVAQLVGDNTFKLLAVQGLK